mgnify:CR=1 FL=1
MVVAARQRGLRVAMATNQQPHRAAWLDESRAFAEFVEELKRAKDREQFDAFMQKRRSADATRAV